MKSNLQNTQRGITLVALIITVIVLLILATVSIKLIMNGGIIDKAEKGTASYSEEEELEQIKLAVSSAKLAGNGFLTAENLNAELQKVFNNAETVSESSNSFKYKNNKTYTINKDGSVGEYKSVLPANYQEVEYIESTGTQYIDTRINIQSGLTLECYIAQIGEPFVNSVIYNQNKSLYYMGWNANNGLLYYVYNNNTRQSSNLTLETNKMYHIKTILKNGFQSIEVDNTLLKSTSIVGDLLINDKNLLLFGGYDEFGKGITKMRLGETKYYNSSDNLIRNFIPCYSTTTVTDANGTQKPANTKGLYDTVEGKFYTNQGGGADFIAGPNV